MLATVAAVVCSGFNMITRRGPIAGPYIPNPNSIRCPVSGPRRISHLVTPVTNPRLPANARARPGDLANETSSSRNT